MLFKRATLEGIRAGEITLAFRRWKAARVVPGARLRTAVGVLVVDDVATVDPAEVRDRDARRAGFADKAALLAGLPSPDAGPLWRVRLAFLGDDPRRRLASAPIAADGALAALRAALARIGRARDGDGAFARNLAILELIAARPGTPARCLAAAFGSDTPAFKRRVRALKELGLTESLAVGYALSPRGRSALDLLRARKRAARRRGRP